MRTVNVQPLGLVIGTIIPIDAQPCQGVKNRLHRSFRRALDVGILQAQHETATGVPGIEPVEKRRPGAAHMQIAGRAGGKACDDRIHSRFLL